MTHPIVVLGTGLAGYTFAREFRKLDKTTPLLIISRDHAGFYSKPMLSNALAGNKTPASLVMKDAEKMAAELAATVWPLTEVQSIQIDAHTLTLSDGRTQPYRDLVLALGADPIRLPLAGDAAQAAISVNDLDDYSRFAQSLEGAKTVAILGAGLIGCEFANDLLARGITPTVIDLAPRVLPRLLPEAASAWMAQRLQTAGVQLRLGVSVAEVRAQGEALALTLSDGSTLNADRLLSAVGLRPRTALASAAGLQVSQGIVTNRLLATSAAQVHALGDCAEVDGLTLPYVMPLMQQARALAATLAGQPTPVTYPAMPVTVKTPACPTVVCPPPPGVSGSWAVLPTDTACEARYTAEDGRLLGFALLGTATAQRQALAAQTPGWLGTPA